MQNLLNEITSEQFTKMDLEGYRISSVEREYAELKQRWIVVESQQKKALDLKQLDKKVEKVTLQAQKQLQQLSRQEFACEEDTWTAITKLEKRLEWHHLKDISVVEKCHYSHRGKPRQHEQPTRRSYHVQATLTLNIEKVEALPQRAGRFVLATNHLDNQSLRDEELLIQYKQQQGDECGFRFLKDPLFLASSVFLKTPERIMALAFIMALCLLVYNLGQRQLRMALSEKNKTVLNQLKKPIQNPTLRWIFQCFQGIHWVGSDNGSQIINLTLERERILRFFGATTFKYYLFL